MNEEFNVDYKLLKSRIIRSCVSKEKEIVDFSIDYCKLVELCEELNITPIYFGMEAKRVKPELIPYINEYFKDENLSWFNSSKFSTVISFIHTNYIDDRARELLERLKVPQVDKPENEKDDKDEDEDEKDNPDDDKVADVAELLANYPCYSATVVAYKSNNPKYIKFNKPSYVIQIRGNKVTISNSDYQYNYKDIS